MKKFSYRLETLLKLKEHLEKERQLELAVAVTHVHKQQERLGDVERQRQETLDQQRTLQVGQLPVGQLLNASRFLLKLKGEKFAGFELLRGLERQADKKREKLLIAVKEKKVHEKLKERAQKKYQDTIQDYERKEADEIGINTFRLGKRKVE
ncbi:MAG: flagellar export protein FliJ [candidate division Zixibacteria bacterium]|nr:flagellar export protein FliJ [candidate division Zixibacteria bacterium]